MFCTQYGNRINSSQKFRKECIAKLAGAECMTDCTLGSKTKSYIIPYLSNVTYDNFTIIPKGVSWCRWDRGVHGKKGEGRLAGGLYCLVAVFLASWKSVAHLIN